MMTYVGKLTFSYMEILASSFPSKRSNFRQNRLTSTIITDIFLHFGGHVADDVIKFSDVILTVICIAKAFTTNCTRK